MEKECRTYLYCRVSTKEQNLDRQLNLAKKYRIVSKNIFSEKISGKISGQDRPVFSYLIDVILRKGDILVFDSLSRLGRNYKDILKNWNLLNEIGVQVVIDDMPLLDTRKKNKNDDILNKMIVDIVTVIFAYCAQKEIEDRKRAQMKGIEMARQNGKNIGRPRIEFPKNWKEEYTNWKNNKQTATQTMRKLGMSHSTFYRMVKLYEKKM